MTEEEKKKYDGAIAEIAKVKADLAQAIIDRDKSNTDLTKAQVDIKKFGVDLKKKDEIIAQKTKDVVGARKKLSERTKEELETMTDAEKEAIQRTEENEAALETMRKESLEKSAKERDAGIDAQIKKITNKPEIASKIKENIQRLNGWDKATLPAEIEKIVNDGYELLGSLKPAAVQSAANGADGSPPGEGDKKSFADSPEGIDLMNKIGPITPPGIVAATAK